MHLDALLLSRLQFGFVIAFHILFPSFTVGLASFLAVLEGLWLATGKERFRSLYLFWSKIFAISFGMGVVSGVVLSYQIGAGWSVYSRQVGPAIGPLFAFEVLTAFFLEASFLGVMLFGWRKVGPRLHFIATALVALGTLISAFWIVSANSWMQHPAGFARAADGRFLAVDWWQVIFNPTFPTRFAHMVLAAYLTTALVVGAASAFQLLRRPDQAESRAGLRMAIGMFALVAPLQLVAGDMSGKLMAHYQPAKLAAVEGFWETRAEQAFHVVAWPDREAQDNRFELAIPKLGSLIVAGDASKEIRGLKSFARQDQPPAAIVFWAFRVMVGLGLLMIALGFVGVFLWLRGRLEATRLYLRACIAMAPAGFIAVVAGWIVAEVGRQPYVVYGYLRTADAVSPVPAAHVATSLIVFMLVYASVFSAGALYIFRLVVLGPQAVNQAAPESPGAQFPEAPGHGLGDPP